MRGLMCAISLLAGCDLILLSEHPPERDASPDMQPEAAAPSCIADDFEDGTLDTAAWNVLSRGTLPATVEERVGRLAIVLPPKIVVLGGIATHRAYDFTMGAVSVQVVTPPSGEVLEAGFDLAISSSNNYGISIDGGLIQFRTTANGMEQSSGRIAYDVAQQAFLQIRHDAIGGAMIYETSPDGQAWMKAFTTPVSVPLAELYLSVYADTYASTNADPVVVQFDNVRMTTPDCP